jgi:hypothetical protein
MLFQSKAALLDKIEKMWGQRVVVLTIFNLGSGWRKVVSYTLWPFYLQVKNDRYSLYRRLNGN